VFLAVASASVGLVWPGTFGKAKSPFKTAGIVFATASATNLSRIGGASPLSAGWIGSGGALSA